MNPATNRRGRHPYSRPPLGNPDAHWMHDLADANEDRKSHGNTPNTGDEPVRLFVSNLHYEVTQKDLSSIFGTIGTLLREPTIRYDRSGRSTGAATIVFAHARDAKLAQKQLDGVMAKGETMSVKLDSAPANSRSQASAGRTSTNTLLSRIEKKPLVDRMSEGNEGKKAAGEKVGPVRSLRGKGKQGGGRGFRVKPAAKTAEDLDKELEAFMGEGDAKIEREKEDVAMA